MGRKSNKKLGIIVGSIGLGIVVTIIVPIWGWLLAVGFGLIYIGWWIMNKCR
ncbi:hypothetical protein AAGC94_15645 [Clostridium sporogenes]|uniref:Uncharacterized protein n=4 Tax=Clostridium TaxID=1485 RepID=A0A2P1TYM6_CLOBO|nr:MULTISPECIES: hypothetical protein [Clostridium]AJD29582.1 putative membrane protein [Clostridium botulinum Prevot_594]MBE6077560.1 hypothetical protein [Clostridium lundense]AKC63314.1 hypothetical protein CLSPO_c25940 [Clostridium sporogenes]AKJ90498.1 hypothetical protein CLSPOx_12985 [Clostridium sporogenes]APF26729.1 putative membrane protein [Clostridium sporogenes]